MTPRLTPSQCTLHDGVIVAPRIAFGAAGEEALVSGLAWDHREKLATSSPRVKRSPPADRQPPS